MYRESFEVIADGSAEIVKWARLCCHEGADSIKLNVSGGNPSSSGCSFAWAIALIATFPRKKPLKPELSYLRDFAKRYAAAWCRRFVLLPGGSLSINGGAPAVGPQRDR